ncbi:putative protein kinase RLK-Pelle-LRR-XII-1 family [Rosa chinensis]|uniref:non-specific serine/threonine protein kinase n=1 Tax=Rosa chinensis TaxID=74649 RepID=A0A2P6SHK9_ROSCH|nr:putative protein kinase RLK-Pelle-LRR-XII-1 family [Rosa chinensis]
MIFGEQYQLGVFLRMYISANSVVGNIGLCSVTANLQLPLCKSKESKGGRLSRRMKIMISLVSRFTLLGIVVVIYILFRCSRKKMKGTELSTLGNSMLQVSYASLLNATNGFSSTNFISIGAFGSVYKGILDDDAAIIAVKVFNMLHRGASKSFISECEALRNIRHRNLLTEAPKSLNLVQRVDITIDVASALDYLHSQCATPIVHCDLKPSNVLLDSDLTGHVSDFGLSRFLTAPTTNVPENQSSSIGIRGSVGYVAPEYGMGSEVSVYGDVYSFGILLLEMFTGKRPTDHMFSDGLNLHNYVKTALPECVSEISKSLALQEGTASVVEAHRQLSVTPQKIEECLTLIFGIGIACSTDSPTNRKDISQLN